MQRRNILILALAFTSSAGAQVISEDFSTGNPNQWGPDFTLAATHLNSGGNPGGCIEMTVAGGGSSFPVRTIVPGAVGHPWRGNLRSANVTGFRYDREVVMGASNFGTRLQLVLGSDNGTRTNVTDDTWVWVATGDVFQFGSSPWTTFQVALPSNSSVLPANWFAAALPNSPNLGVDDDTLWNTVIQDVDFVGLAMNTPYNGGGWFGNHVLRLDNLVLESAGIGAAYCTPAAPNSTGASATIALSGSPLAAQNDVVVRAAALPQQSFGFFLTSRTPGFIAQPGGSAGNLCLGSAIGRFVGPGQIQSSGTSGTIALTLDLTRLPQPSGPVAGAAGETWHFQAWYRDAVGGAPTSNFTSGIALPLQ